MNKLMGELVNTILDKGAELSIAKRGGQMVVDLQTGAKSHGWLVEEGDKVFFEGRYDLKNEVSDIGDVYMEVKGCLHGRDYMSEFWIETLKEEGLLEIYTETKTYFK